VSAIPVGVEVNELESNLESGAKVAIERSALCRQETPLARCSSSRGVGARTDPSQRTELAECRSAGVRAQSQHR
jgi:hypothetical protein